MASTLERLGIVRLSPGDSCALRRIAELTNDSIDRMTRAVIRDHIARQARMVGTTYLALSAAGRVPVDALASSDTPNAYPQPRPSRRSAYGPDCVALTLTPGDSRAVRALARLTGRSIESIVRAAVRGMIVYVAGKLGVGYRLLAMPDVRQPSAAQLHRQEIVN